MTLLSFILIIIILIILGYFIKKWSNGPLNPIKADLTGKLIIVTGSSDGIGVETAKDLLNSNAKVIYACRNKTKTEKVINDLPENLRKNAIFEQLDLASFKSIENFAKSIKSKYPKIDMLINNAGIVTGSRKTEDGYIDIYQVNYLGNVLITLLLLDHLNEKESRILILVTSFYHYSKLTYGDSKILNNYDLMMDKISNYLMKEMFLYMDTKLLLIYFTQYLVNYFEKKNQNTKIVSLHPGMISTNMLKMEKMNILDYLKVNLINKPLAILFIKDVIHGAQTTLFLAHSDYKDLVNGGYYKDLKFENYAPIAKDAKLRNEMVNETLNILKSKYKELEYLPLSE